MSLEVKLGMVGCGTPITVTVTVTLTLIPILTLKRLGRVGLPVPTRSHKNRQPSSMPGSNSCQKTYLTQILTRTLTLATLTLPLSSTYLTLMMTPAIGKTFKIPLTPTLVLTLTLRNVKSYVGSKYP